MLADARGGNYELQTLTGFLRPTRMNMLFKVLRNDEILPPGVVLSFRTSRIIAKRIVQARPQAPICSRLTVFPSVFSTVYAGTATSKLWELGDAAFNGRFATINQRIGRLWTVDGKR